MSSPLHWPAVGLGLWSNGVEDLLENVASSKLFQLGRQFKSNRLGIS